MKTSDLAVPRPGHEALWLWFGLSRASWLTIPRVLMHDMPDEWQGKMSVLLDEFTEAYPNQPDIGTEVVITGDHHENAYDWLNNYRYPQKDKINTLKSQG